MSKYLKLDLEAIRRDFPQVWANYEKEFEITCVLGRHCEYPLEKGQQVITGDYKSFHFLLTKK